MRQHHTFCDRRSPSQSRLRRASSPEGRATRLRRCYLHREPPHAKFSDSSAPYQRTAAKPRASPFGGSAERSEAKGGLSSQHRIFCDGEYESPCHFVTSPFRQGGRGRTGNPGWRMLGLLRPQVLTSSASLRSAPSPASGKAVPYGKLICLNYVLCCAHEFRYGKASPMPGKLSRSD